MSKIFQKCNENFLPKNLKSGQIKQTKTSCYVHKIARTFRASANYYNWVSLFLWSDHFLDFWIEIFTMLHFWKILDTKTLFWNYLTFRLRSLYAVVCSLWLASLISIIRGCSQTKLTRFWLFFDHLPTCVDILYGMVWYGMVDKKWTFLDRLPRLVNVVCEQPLILILNPKLNLQKLSKSKMYEKTVPE